MISLKKKKNLKLRYIGSFFMIIIPVLIIGIFLYTFNINNDKTFIMNVKYSNFQKAVSQLDNYIEKFDSISSYLSDNADILIEANKVNQDEINDYTVISTLSKLEKNISVESKMLLYFRGDKYIYSSSEKILYLDFKNAINEEADLVMSSFYTNITTSTVSLLIQLNDDFLDRSQEQGLVAYIVPLPSLANVPQMSLVFLISDTALGGEFENILGESMGNIYIYNHNDLEMVYDNDENHEDSAIFDQMTVYKLKGTGIFRRTINGEKYVIMRSVSEESQLTSVVIMKESSFLEELAPGQRVLVFLISALVIFSALFVFLIAYFNYKPIKGLVSDILDSDFDEVYLNEFDAIRAVYRRSRERNIELSQQLEEQHAIMISQFILGIISGRCSSKEEYEYYRKCADLELKKKFFAALKLSIYGKLSKNQIEIILSISRDFSPDNIDVIFSELTGENGVCYILNFDCNANECKKNIQSAAWQLYNIMQNNNIANILIGAGAECTNPMLINRSFYEAAASLQTANLLNNPYIYEYSETKIQDNCNHDLPHIEQSLFVESIRYGDVDMALNEFEEMLKQIEELANSAWAKQLLCNNILNTIIQLAERHNINLVPQQFEILGFFKSISEFHNSTADFISYVCREIKVKNNQDIMKIKKDVIEYINKNYKNPDFQLEMVASTLNMTKHKINSILKEDVGYSFVQYTSIIRLNEVKRQLRLTERKIKDIVMDVGYMDVSNFVRKFKTLVGITPGQYRVLYSEKSN